MKLNRLFLSIVSVLTFSAAHALDIKPYSETSFAQAQAEGKPAALHFHADWCPICKKQTSVLESLKTDKSLDLTVYVANYDLEEALKKQLNVKGQSTLIVYKGKVEKARLAGQTASDAIKSALSAAL